MEAPTISTRTDLSLSEAKKEYIELEFHLKNKPKFGWVKAIQIQIDNRLDFVKTIIADKVCGVKK